LLEDLTIQRHAHDQRGYPSEFVFGQWASGLKRLMLSDPHLRILPSLTSLPILDSLDLTDCNQLQSVDTQDVRESLSTLILNRCSALRYVPPLARFKHLTYLRSRVVPPSI
jgi:Leucine-rich repeat (LRR) protein